MKRLLDNAFFFIAAASITIIAGTFAGWMFGTYVLSLMEKVP